MDVFFKHLTSFDSDVATRNFAIHDGPFASELYSKIHTIRKMLQDFTLIGIRISLISTRDILLLKYNFRLIAKSIIILLHRLI